MTDPAMDAMEEIIFMCDVKPRRHTRPAKSPFHRISVNESLDS